MSEMSLPEGQTCGNCNLFDNCHGIIGVKESNTECDFYPIKFRFNFKKENEHLKSELAKQKRILELMAEYIASSQDGWPCDYNYCQNSSGCHKKDKNILTKSFLSKLRKTDHKKVVYADKNYLDDEILLKYDIQFKQIPYEVKVY